MDGFPLTDAKYLFTEKYNVVESLSQLNDNAQNTVLDAAEGLNFQYSACILQFYTGF